jgi:hypothetical protein
MNNNACEQPKFQQSLPKDGEFELLTSDAKRSGSLLYRDVKTGKEILVPNVWYNQPVEWSIKAAESYIADNEGRLDYWRKGQQQALVSGRTGLSQGLQIEQLERSTRRLKDLVDEMRRTGKPAM